MRARVSSHRTQDSVPVNSKERNKKNPRGGIVANSRMSGLSNWLVTKLDDNHDDHLNDDHDHDNNEYDDDNILKNRRKNYGRRCIRKLWLKLQRIQNWRYASFHTSILCIPPDWPSILSIKYKNILARMFLILLLSSIILRSYQLIQQPRFNLRHSRKVWNRKFPLQIRLDGIQLQALNIKFLDDSIGAYKSYDFCLKIPSIVSNPTSQFNFPYQLDEPLTKEGSIPDYNGLIILRLVDPNDHRVIYHNSTEDEGQLRDYSVRDDDVVSYYSMDDDFVRDGYKTFDNKSEVNENGTCRRLPWHMYHFPNCNTFHEMNIAVNIPTFYGAGSYRMALTHTHQYLANSNTLIWRQSLWNPPYTYVSMPMIDLDVSSLGFKSTISHRLPRRICMSSLVWMLS
jgi:hypothetical protein